MGLANSISGPDGKIEVVGLGAVAALIQRWTLERRGDDGSGKPIWILRASLSYQNEMWFTKSTMRKRAELRLDAKTVYAAEAVDDAEWRVEGNSLIVEGVKAWVK